jgi:hypothetical protein
MGNPAGVPRDFEALEKRRFQAMQMLERGLRQAEIARLSMNPGRPSRIRAYMQLRPAFVGLSFLLAMWSSPIADFVFVQRFTGEDSLASNKAGAFLP